MARLYADEQFPLEVVEYLCRLGHDVLTVQAAGNANLKIPDDLVLEFATTNDRVVLTFRVNTCLIHFDARIELLTIFDSSIFVLLSSGMSNKFAQFLGSIVCFIPLGIK